jgi:KaiC/GvpD/RAD55 family RecA-like ATPase
MSERLSTGVRGLNAMTSGGFIPGTTILVSGQAGTGKTTFAMQFIYEGAKAGEPGLFITMEQDKGKLMCDMASVGMDIPKMGKKISIIGGNIGEIMRIRKLVKSNLNDFLAEIEDVVRQNKIRRVALDSMNLFLMLFEEEEDRRYAMLELCYRLNKLSCTTVLTCETKGPEMTSWYGFEDFVVDDVIALMNVRMEHYYKHALSVRKMRGSAHDKSIVAYEITPKGVVVNSEDVVIPA